MTKKSKLAFATRLKKIRTKLDLSQRAFAKRIRRSQSQVSKWESGMFFPTERTVEHLSKRLGMKPGQLMRGVA